MLQICCNLRDFSERKFPVKKFLWLYGTLIFWLIFQLSYNFSEFSVKLTFCRILEFCCSVEFK